MLDQAQWSALVDNAARYYMGMTGAEFIAAYQRGDFDDHSHPQHCEATIVAMLLPGQDHA